MERSKIFDRQAGLYEAVRSERVFGAWRERLLETAGGKVLEIAVGTGANFPYYPGNVHLTAVDISPKMMRRAVKTANRLSLDADCILADIERMDFDQGQFDTIVSTLSFCGYENPVAMFNKLARWVKPEGQVLLMEHGISTEPWIAKGQRAIDGWHKKIIGCHQKRDMVALIEASDLAIEGMESHYRGIFRLFWARPKK